MSPRGIGGSEQLLFVLCAFITSTTIDDDNNSNNNMYGPQILHSMRPRPTIPPSTGGIYNIPTSIWSEAALYAILKFGLRKARRLHTAPRASYLCLVIEE